MDNQQFQKFMMESIAKATDQVVKMEQRVTQIEEQVGKQPDLGAIKKQLVTKQELASALKNLPAGGKADTVPCEHQDVLGEIFFQFKAYLRNKTAKVYIAPFDVDLSQNEDEPVILQPDIVVVNDKSKISGKFCKGAPDFVVEVLSPDTIATDYIAKMSLYEKAGVAEYWIVHPTDKIVMAFRLKNGEYGKPGIYVKGNEVPVGIFKDLTITLNEVFISEEDED